MSRVKGGFNDSAHKLPSIRYASTPFLIFLKHRGVPKISKEPRRFLKAQKNCLFQALEGNGTNLSCAVYYRLVTPEMAVKTQISCLVLCIHCTFLEKASSFSLDLLEIIENLYVLGGLTAVCSPIIQVFSNSASGPAESPLVLQLNYSICYMVSGYVAFNVHF